MSKKTPEVRISANRINDSAPDVNPEFGARVLPAALQFCRCGGLWNAKGHPDGFPSHDPSLRNFRLGRFFDSLIPVHFFGRMISRSNQEQQPRQNEQHNIATTSNIYTHLNFSSKVASANAIMGVYPSL